MAKIMAKIIAKIMAKTGMAKRCMHASIKRARLTYVRCGGLGVFCHALAYPITASGACLHLFVPPLPQCFSPLVFLAYITSCIWAKVYLGKTVWVYFQW